MSDMQESDVPAEPEVVAEQPAADAPENVVEAVSDANVESDQTPAPEATPVVARQPSSASPTQASEEAPEPEAEGPSLKDAARNVIALVRAHRTAGDSDLDAALVAVERALEQSA